MTELQFTGTVRKSPLGAWTIEADGGTVYELAQPVDRRLLQTGLRVKLTGKPRPDLMSMHMVGTILEVVHFEAI
jgi:hypothetical protein